MTSAARRRSAARPPWNHNIHYHGVILDALPRPCRRALDIGCGQGHLARALAARCGEVVALDVDADVVARAAAAGDGATNLRFEVGDALDHPLEEGSFDAVTLVATLHHLPLRAALRRVRALLRPGGLLGVVGLYRAGSIAEKARAAPGVPAHWLLRLRRGHTEVEAALRDPSETLAEIRAVAAEELPGAEIRRRLLFRCTLLWVKPGISEGAVRD